MFPSTPPAASLSRPRLKAITKWVRDELDVLVAREGPNVLRPDDVLTLHETFIALCHAPDITALDLRATGIHRAVQDIAGVATRWPGRLCDDCDKIISIWTAKFGPLEQLRPFLYGRGGRLEGIASVTEYSREALLKRWSEHCPEKIHPKRSHRLGGLGFKAGDWWINTLFAHHAGIIGLEAVEGGTTFDKHGAYAVVLKNTGEVEAGHGDSFTYRVPQWDKGKFRLTAATPRSRDPIRVLRSHSINSVWGPKAGVRFEGLYGVKGWSIRQAKSADTAGGQWKEGDVIFEVRFERQDPVSMEEVCNRPTATEVDDYAEYKRLRKQHREDKRKTVGSTMDLSGTVPPLVTKAAPPTAPPISTTNIPPKILRMRSGSTTQRIHFRHPHFDLPEEVPHEQINVVSPTNIEESSQFPFSQRHSTTAVTPQPMDRRPNVQGGTDESSIVSIKGSMNSSVNTDPLAKIKEVAPWIDFEADLTLPSSATPIAPAPTPSLLSTSGTKKKKRNLVNDANMQTPKHAMDSPPLSTVGERRKSGNFKNMTGFLSPSASTTKPSDRKSIFMRSRNPMAKLFDGAASLEDEENDNDDVFATGPTVPPPRPQHTTPNRYKHHTSSSDVTSRVHSPIPIRTFSPPLAFTTPHYRNSISSSDNDNEASSTRHVHTIALPKDDPFIEIQRPTWLEELISSPRAATARSTVASALYVEKDAVDAEERLRMSMESWDGKMGWRNPWGGEAAKEGRRDSGGEEVAPDVVG